MKHTIILLAALLALGAKPLFAQQTVVPRAVHTTVTSGKTVTPTATQNYTCTETYREKTSPSMANLSHVNVDIQYFDGLGRPIETVAVKASPTGKDIVALQTYDSYGRDDKSDLPLAYSTDNRGAFVSPTNVTNNLPTYIDANYDVIGTDANYGFSQPQYESSPLNRILKQGTP